LPPDTLTLHPPGTTSSGRITVVVKRPCSSTGTRPISTGIAITVLLGLSDTATEMRGCHPLPTIVSRSPRAAESGANVIAGVGSSMRVTAIVAADGRADAGVPPDGCEPQAAVQTTKTPVANVHPIRRNTLPPRITLPRTA
jgi:hypothetical protein